MGNKDQVCENHVFCCQTVSTVTLLRQADLGVGVPNKSTYQDHVSKNEKQKHTKKIFPQNKAHTFITT